ncbi:MAG: hypothetical protein AB1458_16090 [Bacteroidota bacterium]
MDHKSSVNQRFHTRVSEIWIGDDGIMRVVFAKNATIDLADMEEAYRIFSDMGFGPGKKKSRQLLSGGPVTLKKEAREYADRTGQDFFVAAALVSDSVLMRFVINLFNTIHRHGVPFRIFSNEANALSWLKTF